MSYRGEQKIKDKIYVYEAVAVWNPDKKRSEQRRVYIGRRDPETGAFIPNRKYEEIENAKKAGMSVDDAILKMFTEKPAGSSRGNTAERVPKTENHAEAAEKVYVRNMSDHAESKAVPPPVSAPAVPAPVSAEEYGRSSALRQLARSCGLITVLQQTLPGSGKKYLDRAITGSGKIPALDEASANVFFQSWIGHCGDLHYLSLYTEMTRFYPKEEKKDRPARSGKSAVSASKSISVSGYHMVPQLNILFGSDSELPVYYRYEEKEPPSARDLITGFAFLKPLDLLQIRFCFQEDLYTDKDFFLLLQHGFRFTLRIPMNAMPAASLLKGFDPDDHAGEIAADIGGVHFQIQSRRTMINGREVYCHFCCDTAVRQVVQARLLHHVCTLEQRVSDGSLQMTDTAVRRYLSFSKRAGEGWNCERRTDVIREELKYAGFFILLSNAESNGVRVLKTCMDQNAAEKIFNRPHVSADSLPQVQDIQGSDPWPPEESASGLFCSFLELVLYAYLQRKIHHAITEGLLSGSSTPESILEELSAIRRITMSDGTRVITQLTQRQEAICEALGLQI